MPKTQKAGPTRCFLRTKDNEKVEEKMEKKIEEAVEEEFEEEVEIMTSSVRTIT